jgi:hypothetical protein
MSIQENKGAQALGRFFSISDCSFERGAWLFYDGAFHEHPQRTA